MNRQGKRFAGSRSNARVNNRNNKRRRPMQRRGPSYQTQRSVRRTYIVNAGVVTGAGLSLGIGPDPARYRGSSYVTGASEYNNYTIKNVSVRFITSLNETTATGQICAWVSPDPKSSVPTTAEQIFDQQSSAGGVVRFASRTWMQNFRLPRFKMLAYSTGSGDLSGDGTSYEECGKIHVAVPGGDTKTSYGRVQLMVAVEYTGPGASNLVNPSSVGVTAEPITEIINKTGNFVQLNRIEQQKYVYEGMIERGDTKYLSLTKGGEFMIIADGTNNGTADSKYVTIDSLNNKPYNNITIDAKLPFTIKDSVELATKDDDKFDISDRFIGTFKLNVKQVTSNGVTSIIGWEKISNIQPDVGKVYLTNPKVALGGEVESVGNAFSKWITDLVLKTSAQGVSDVVINKPDTTTDPETGEKTTVYEPVYPLDVDISETKGFLQNIGFKV